MESNAWCPHLTAAIILAGSAVQKGFGLLVVLREEAVDSGPEVHDRM
jgi:hypothetical protein